VFDLRGLTRGSPAECEVDMGREPTINVVSVRVVKE